MCVVGGEKREREREEGDSFDKEGKVFEVRGEKRRKRSGKKLRFNKKKKKMGGREFVVCFMVFCMGGGDVRGGRGGTRLPT